MWLNNKINAVWETTTCQFAKGRDYFGPRHRAKI